MVEALSEMEQEYSEVAVMLALTHGSSSASTGNIQLGEAVWAITDKGWPADWYITNDEENYFPRENYNGIPWVVIVRMGDMKVVEKSNIKYTASNVDELLEFVQGL